jgi:hypothetical protein
VVSCNWLMVRKEIYLFTIGKPCAPALPMTRTAFWLVIFLIGLFLKMQLILEIIPKRKKTCGSFDLLSNKQHVVYAI